MSEPPSDTPTTNRINRKARHMTRYPVKWFNEERGFVFITPDGSPAVNVCACCGRSGAIA